MSRRIVIDTDTLTGYDFQNDLFYVTNKGTTTTRTTKELTKQVLDIVAPNNTVTLQDLQNLHDTYEVIYSLYYTLEDTGAYIKTIQINDYATYPITLDADKHKLYVMNTNLVFDLLLNEQKQSRVEHLLSHFKTNLGINIPYQDMLALYDLLIALYKPSVFNLINSEIQTPLTYSNKFSLTNYTNKAQATYTCISNPSNTFTPSTLQQDTGYVLSTNTNSNTIQLTALPQTLTQGKKFYLSNATVVQDTYTSTADGIYTVKSTDSTSNSIVTEETIPLAYTFTYPVVHVISSQLNISSISRDSSQIVCASTIPNSIQAGDIIHVSGTQQYVEYETVTCDGAYTVARIDTVNNIITVQEMPNTNYAYSTGTYPTLSKHIYVGDIADITSNRITLVSPTTISLITGTKIIVTRDNTETIYTVSSSTSTVITVQETIQSYTPNYPTVKLQVPNTNILINTTYSNNPSVFPTGEFIVDNFTQCQNYLLTYLPSTFVPTNTIRDNMNNLVPTTKTVSASLPTMQLKGIYSSIYTDI